MHPTRRAYRQIRTPAHPVRATIPGSRVKVSSKEPEQDAERERPDADPGNICPQKQEQDPGDIRGRIVMPDRVPAG